MKVMSHYNEPLSGFHPLLGFVVSLGLMIAGQNVDSLNTILETVHPIPMRIPPILLDCLQGLAYLGTTFVGTVAVLKFWAEIRVKIKKPKFPKK